jgi:Acyl-CoA dehydrogenase N terminal
MSDYQPRPGDIRFILKDVLGAPAFLQGLSAYAEVDGELMDQVLEESAKFVGEVVAPLQRIGDAVGARHTTESGTGKVTMRAFGTPTRASGKAAGQRWPAPPRTVARACPQCWRPRCTKC